MEGNLGVDGLLACVISDYFNWNLCDLETYQQQHPISFAQIEQALFLMILKYAYSEMNATDADEIPMPTLNIVGESFVQQRQTSNPPAKNEKGNPKDLEMQVFFECYANIGRTSAAFSIEDDEDKEVMLGSKME
jgi:hypothetical protein